MCLFVARPFHLVRFDLLSGHLPLNAHLLIPCLSKFRLLNKLIKTVPIHLRECMCTHRRAELISYDIPWTSAGRHWHDWWADLLRKIQLLERLRSICLVFPELLRTNLSRRYMRGACWDEISGNDAIEIILVSLHVEMKENQNAYCRFLRLHSEELHF